MDPVTMIVSALAAGAAAGGKSLAGTVLADAYAGLKRLVTARFAAAKPDDRSTPVPPDAVLAAHEQDPGPWAGPLEAALRSTGAADDPALVEAARQVLAAADPDGSASGKYRTTVTGSTGVQIGDHGSMTVHAAPPDRR